MARTEQISVEVVQLTSALAKLASAGAKAQQSAASLDTLGKEVESVITRLSKAPQVSANTSQLVYGLGNLASAGASGRKALDSLYGSSGRSSSMLSKLGNIARGTGKAISGMGRQTSLSNKGILGMANSIAMLAGRYWVLIAGLRKGAQAIGSAMDYVETLNYFNNTLDTMGNRANEKWQEIGFSSAEEYASSFRDRAEAIENAKDTTKSVEIDSLNYHYQDFYVGGFSCYIGVHINKESQYGEIIYGNWKPAKE
jgi:hypothetical protein